MRMLFIVGLNPNVETKFVLLLVPLSPLVVLLLVFKLRYKFLVYMDPVWYV